jgi:hypothetical protein
MSRFAHPIQDDDIGISEELIGRLHGATESGVLELVATFRANQRAILAMHCYRKSHLRWTGLMIASTCDLSSLVQECGPGLGGAIFAQSRRRSEEPRRIIGLGRDGLILWDLTDSGGSDGTLVGLFGQAAAAPAARSLFEDQRYEAGLE